MGGSLRRERHRPSQRRCRHHDAPREPMRRPVHNTVFGDSVNRCRFVSVAADTDSGSGRRINASSSKRTLAASSYRRRPGRSVFVAVVASVVATIGMAAIVAAAAPDTTNRQDDQPIEDTDRQIRTPNTEYRHIEEYNTDVRHQRLQTDRVMEQASKALEGAMKNHESSKER